jgi:hypothetical protein
MKFLIRTLTASFVLALAAPAVDAQTQQSNGASRGQFSSFSFGRNVQSTPHADPVNSPAQTANPMSRPVGRFGPVTPVPEPSEWAMMLAGLALVGFIVRRNSKRS